MRTMTRFDETSDWQWYRKLPLFIRAVMLTEDAWISTLEGLMHGHRGDMLIEGVEGELYVCKASVFTKTYERSPGSPPFQSEK